jgi:hypothetical protein
MTNNAHYIRLPDAVREAVRATARTQAVVAIEHYADLLAAEAGIAARALFPELTRLLFRITDDINGPGVSLVAAYASDKRQLWNADIRDWPDESLVTDRLAAAIDWCDDYFAKADDSDDLFLLDVDEGQRSDEPR